MDIVTSFDISITPLNTLDRSIKNVRTIPSKCFDDKMLGKRKREREREREVMESVRSY